MTAMPQQPSAFRLRLEGWRRHALAFVAGAAVVLLAGLYLALLAVPNEYEAATAIVAPRGEGAAVSRDYAAEVAHSSVLEPAAERLGLAAAGAPATVRQAAGEALRAQLAVSPTVLPSGDVEVRVAARGRDAEALARLVSAVAEAYVSQCTARNGAATEKADALAKDVSRLTAGLGEVTPMAASARAALRDFESQHAVVLADAKDDPDAALRTLAEDERRAAADYDKTQAEVAGLASAEKLLRARLAEVPEFDETKEVTTVRNPELVTLEREIRQMEKQLEELLRVYTFKHPEVIALQTDLLLKKRQLRQIQERVEDSVKSSKSKNPEYAVLKGKLDDTVVKLQVATSALTPLANRRQTLAGRAAALRECIEPWRRLKDRLAEVTKLEQDNRSLLETKESELQKARALLEPVPRTGPAGATAPVRVGPERRAWAVLAALAALGAGWLSMTAAHRLSPRFAGAGEVAEFAGVPVAGTVGAAAGTEAEDAGRLRRRLYLATTLGIAAAAGAVIAVFAHYSGR